MPFQEGCRFDNNERVAPVEESCQCDHPESERGGRAAWPDLPFRKEGQLPSQEEILGNECRAGKEEQPEENDQTRFYSFPWGTQTERAPTGELRY